jgi:hypothetical protein
MRPANRGGRQARLLRQGHNFHGGHHNIQNPHQQHPFHRRRSHDDDGHKKLIFGQSIATIWIQNVVITLPGRDS